MIPFVNTRRPRAAEVFHFTCAPFLTITFKRISQSQRMFVRVNKSPKCFFFEGNIFLKSFSGRFSTVIDRQKYMARY